MGRANHNNSSSGRSNKKLKEKMYYQNQSRRGRGGGGGGSGSGSGGGYRQRESLVAGMQGFLCFCNYNERDCVKEAYNLLNEYWDRSEEAKVAEPEDNDVEADADVPVPVEEEDDDIESAIAAEVKELNHPLKKFRFQSIQSGARNIVFIKSTVPEPSKLVHDILSDVFTMKQQKSRYLLRILPIEATCHTNMEELRTTAKTILSKYFTSGLFQSFQVVYKCRYNDKVNRDEVIRCVAEVANEINQLSVVDLTNPQLVIIVEVIKGVVCIGVAKDFNKFRKYNLIEASGEKEGGVKEGATAGPGPGVPDLDGSGDALLQSKKVEGLCVPEGILEDMHGEGGD